MKRFALTFAIALSAGPVVAEEESGLSIMERGALLFMEGILKEMEPAIQELDGLAEQLGPTLRNFATEMGPKLAEIMDQVEDWSAYQAPEMLPNGDIIIRRKPSHPLVPKKVPTDPAPQIEL